MTIRYDRGEVRKSFKNEDGFLVVDAVVTRTGVFDYRNADGTIRRELRHPDDVFKADSLKSMEMLPITLLHPQQKVVTSENSKELSVGFTGETLQNDGKFITARLKITAQSAIDAIEKEDIKELSLGYSVMLDTQSGVFEDQAYDAVQTDITYNHLAIVPKGRAGAKASIVLDSEDAIQHIDDQKQPTHKPKKGDRMVKHNLDGIEYECSPEIKNHITKSDSAMESLKNDKKDLEKSNSELQANLDAANEKLSKSEKVDHKEEIAKAVEARVKLLSIANDRLDEESLKGIELKSDEEIKKAVILSVSPEAKLDEKDAAYIDARFDGALETKVEKADSVSDQLSSMHRKDSNSSESSKAFNSDEARKEHVKSLTTAWNKKA